MTSIMSVVPLIQQNKRKVEDGFISRPLFILWNTINSMYQSILAVTAEISNNFTRTIFSSVSYISNIRILWSFTNYFLEKLLTHGTLLVWNLTVQKYIDVHMRT